MRRNACRSDCARGGSIRRRCVEPTPYWPARPHRRYDVRYHVETRSHVAAREVRSVLAAAAEVPQSANWSTRLPCRREGGHAANGFRVS